MTPMERAQKIIDECCSDPEMWATHGCPGEQKLMILERKICEAITAAQIELNPDKEITSCKSW